MHVCRDLARDLLRTLLRNLLLSNRFLFRSGGLSSAEIGQAEDAASLVDKKAKITC